MPGTLQSIKEAFSLEFNMGDDRGGEMEAGENMHFSYMYLGLEMGT